MNRRKGRMHPVLKILLTLLVVSVIILIGIFAYVYLQLKGAANDMYDDDFTSETSDLRETDVSFKDGDPISVVLFGTDDDESRNASGMGQRSDTIMVVTLNPNTDEGRMLSIPRDTRTEIVGRDTVEKINHAYAYGGPEMAARTVENFLDMPIDHFLSINMDGFTTIVDELGGITVTSEDTFEQSGYQFRTGETYEMDGDMALAFSRSRKSEGAGGDSGRQKRQQQVVESIGREMLSLKTVSNFGSILNVMGENVRTNIPFNEMNALRSNYQKATQNIERLTLEGTDQRLDDGLWYFIPDDSSFNSTRSELRENLELE